MLECGRSDLLREALMFLGKDKIDTKNEQVGYCVNGMQLISVTETKKQIDLQKIHISGFDTTDVRYCVNGMQLISVTETKKQIDLQKIHISGFDTTDVRMYER